MLPPSDSDEEDLGTLVNNYNRHVCPAHIPNSDSSDSKEASDNCNDNNSDENETLSNNKVASNNESKDSSDVFKIDNDQIS